MYVLGTCVYMCAYVCTCIFSYVYLCVHVCTMYVYVCVYCSLRGRIKGTKCALFSIKCKGAVWKQVDITISKKQALQM